MDEDHPQLEFNIEVDENEVQPAASELSRVGGPQGGGYLPPRQGALAVALELSPRELEEVVKHTLQLAGITQTVALSLLITGDETIQEMNRQYRQQDKPTDVLSFPLLDKPLVNAPCEQLWTQEESGATETETSAVTGAELPRFVTPPELPTNLGDIVISWPTVRRQASEVGHSPGYELLYLLSHGVLHLVGYDDQSEAGYRAMVGLQEAVLQAIGQKA